MIPGICFLLEIRQNVLHDVVGRGQSSGGSTEDDDIALFCHGVKRVGDERRERERMDGYSRSLWKM
jgi:hypothetical protein